MKDFSGTYFSEDGVLVFIQKLPEGSFCDYLYESPISVFQVFESTVSNFVSNQDVVKLDEYIE